MLYLAYLYMKWSLLSQYHLLPGKRFYDVYLYVNILKFSQIWHQMMDPTSRNIN